MIRALQQQMTTRQAVERETFCRFPHVTMRFDHATNRTEDTRKSRALLAIRAAIPLKYPTGLLRMSKCNTFRVTKNNKPSPTHVLMMVALSVIMTTAFGGITMLCDRFDSDQRVNLDLCFRLKNTEMNRDGDNILPLAYLPAGCDVIVTKSHTERVVHQIE